MLGVAEETINTHGAVSKETAIQMAEGALKNSNADLAISVTGVAGPTGGTEEKPVGTCHLALAQKDLSGRGLTGQGLLPTIHIKAFHPTSRDTFRRAISQKSLDLLRQAILKIKS